MHDSSDLLKLPRPLVAFDEEQGDEVGEDGEHVDDVHQALHELELAWGGGESEDVLQGEPGDADGLHHGQLRIVDLAAGLVVGGK